MKDFFSDVGRQLSGTTRQCAATFLRHYETHPRRDEETPGDHFKATLYRVAQEEGYGDFSRAVRALTAQFYVLFREADYLNEGALLGRVSSGTMTASLVSAIRKISATPG